MILDIRYIDRPPEQIRGVRRISYYPHELAPNGPEIIVYSIHDVVSPRYIPLYNVKEMWTTND